MTGLLRANRAAETRNIRDFIDSHQDDLVTQLCEWVRIPSVSSVPEHGADVRRAASWLADADMGES